MQKPCRIRTVNHAESACEKEQGRVTGKRNTPLPPKGAGFPASPVTEVEGQAGDFAETRKSTQVKGRDSGGFADGFERFWKVYPRKVAEDAARKEWAKLKPDTELTERIVQAVKAQVATEQWQKYLKNGGEYIPYPANWLNGKRWEDETPMPEGEGNVFNPKTMKPKCSTVEELAEDFDLWCSAEGCKERGTHVRADGLGHYCRAHAGPDDWTLLDRAPEGFAMKVGA